MHACSSQLFGRIAHMTLVVVCVCVSTETCVYARTHARTRFKSAARSRENERTRKGDQSKTNLKTSWTKIALKIPGTPKNTESYECVYSTSLPTYLHLDKVASHSDNKIGTDFFFFCFGKQKRIKGAI